MQYKNTAQSFGLITILIHWIMAILIIALFVVGKYMLSLDYYDPFYHSGPWWHKNFGLLLTVLLIYRIVWKLRNQKVKPLDSYKNYEINLAKLIQTLLYISLIVCCISGVMISTAKGVGISFFDLFEIPAMIAKGKQQSELAGEIHYFATYTLIILACLHMLAALKHHFFDKDITLTRIFRTNLNEKKL
jgi:cytochrome b561